MDKAAFQKLFQENTKDPQWCPGCGDFTELNVLIRALAELASEDREIHKNVNDFEEMGISGLEAKICKSCPEKHFYPRYEPHTVVTESGIGCAGHMFAYINTYGAKATHGRALPFSLGLKLARPDLTVIPQGGDGDAWAIGAGHFANFAGFNLDITYLVTNNEVYGLTKGQMSPTSPVWLKTGVNPTGPIREPMNPIAVAVSSGWTFVARLVNVGKLTNGFNTAEFSVDILKKAIKHPGSSLVIFETECPTYNKVKTKEWLKERTVPISDVEPNYNPALAIDALKLSLVPEEEKIPIGIYYQVRRSTLHEKLGIEKPLINLKPDREKIKKLLERYS